MVNTVIDICRASELAVKQLKVMNGTDNVERLDSKQTQGQRGRSHSRTRQGFRRDDSERQNGRQCRFCCRIHEFKKSACPAWGKKCKTCFDFNHFAITCKSKNSKPKVRVVHSVNDDDEELLAINSDKKSRVYTKLLINGHSVRLLLDSGSTINLLPSMMIDTLELQQHVRPAESTLRMFNQKELPTRGMVMCTAQHPSTNEVKLLNFYITDCHREALLGIDACKAFNLVKFDNICAALQSEQTLTTESILLHYSDLFEGFGKLHSKTECSRSERTIERPNVTTLERVKKF